MSKPTTIHEEVAEKYGKKDGTIHATTSYTGNSFTIDQIYLEDIAFRLHGISWLLIILTSAVLGFGVLSLL